mmetsp:Transcript_89736/g.253024  ORF Transcript_89736/g.253024 Transcript_89736/m.253024 type:complete len:225 (-) Transcript_89736:1065-1739(-)
MPMSSPRTPARQGPFVASSSGFASTSTWSCIRLVLASIGIATPRIGNLCIMTVRLSARSAPRRRTSPLARPSAASGSSFSCTRSKRPWLISRSPMARSSPLGATSISAGNTASTRCLRRSRTRKAGFPSSFGVLRSMPWTKLGRRRWSWTTPTGARLLPHRCCQRSRCRPSRRMSSSPGRERASRRHLSSAVFGPWATVSSLQLRGARWSTWMAGHVPRCPSPP